ncbi:flagellar protein FlaG [Marichromatium bheemlicum]|uniref:Flagellar protein FlaG n=1 Tax=Marichromatium bheemlicum TaxID=365339 RepID=A0ABX1IAZ3_9GAMM|nr:flagellar protein FlaG [Marichromatium bheemlicum]NKN34702.1 flagellar protein FlaG [Marichromatium bheemlicum]
MASESYTLSNITPIQQPSPVPSRSERDTGTSVAEREANERLERAPGALATQQQVRAQDSAGTETSAERKSAERKEVSEEQLNQAVEQLNEMFGGSRRMLNFELDKEADRTVIRVLDAETEELIRQIPSEETLKFTQYVEGLVGLIFNDQA